MTDPQQGPAGGETTAPTLGADARARVAAARTTRGTISATTRPTRSAGWPLDPVLRVQMNLTARDHTIIAWLGDHGVLTTDQVAFALFPSVDVAQRRLRLLTGLGLLQRFRPLKLDGGSYPFHYVLDHLGALVLAVQRGADTPRPAQTRARMQALTRRPDLGHLLGVNQFFTDLAGYARTHPGASLDRWWPTARCLQGGVFAADPDDITQGAYVAPIRPDAHGVFTDHVPGQPGGSESLSLVTVPFFLEHDTGTESLAVLVRKIDGYQRLARQTGHRWPVLFWLHSGTRERHLHEQLAHASRPTVTVATAARDRTQGLNPADAIWWLHAAGSSPWRRLAALPTTPLPGSASAGHSSSGLGAAAEVIP
jgi:predicted transcriptional regulator